MYLKLAAKLSPRKVAIALIPGLQPEQVDWDYENVYEWAYVDLPEISYSLDITRDHGMNEVADDKLDPIDRLVCARPFRRTDSTHQRLRTVRGVRLPGAHQYRSGRSAPHWQSLTSPRHALDHELSCKKMNLMRRRFLLRIHSRSV